MESKQARWKKAQQYEQAWWAARVEAVDPRFYRAYAEALVRALDGILTITPQTRILEIGSGAAGILTFLRSGHKYAVDPLEDFYGSVDAFAAARDPRVQYFAAKGEDLPFADDAFDLVIIDNVLDHCEDPDQVFAEMQRVLRPGGIVYLRLSLYHTWGKLVRSVVELLQIDQGHPYTFTRAALDALVARHQFAVVRVEGSGYGRTWLRELTSGKAKDLAKALTFATRSKTLYLLRNDENGV